MAAGLISTLAACSPLGDGTAPPGHAASPASSSTPSPRPTPSAAARLPGTVWVLTPLGLNLRSHPSLTAAVVALLPQDARLAVSESQAVGGGTWLHVKDADGTSQGWVLDRPDLVIAVPVSQHIDSVNGYQLLFPTGWTITQPPNQPGETLFASPGGAHEQDVLTVQVGDSLSHLLTIPSQPGHELRTQGPLTVYGQTTYMRIYSLDGGGFEMAVRFHWNPPSPSPVAGAPPPAAGGMRAFLFLLRQSAPGLANPDPSLFTELLGSVMIAG